MVVGLAGADLAEEATGGAGEGGGLGKGEGGMAAAAREEAGLEAAAREEKATAGAARVAAESTMPPSTMRRRKADITSPSPLLTPYAKHPMQNKTFLHTVYLYHYRF